MRVLQVLPALNLGGVEETILLLAQAIVKAGHQSYVASGGGTKVAELQLIGAEHIKVGLNTKNPLVIMLNILILAKLIKKLKIDIVHARSRGPAWSAYFACKLTNAKFITTVHGAHKVQNPVKRLYNSVMVRGCKVIATSDFIKDYILSTYQSYVKAKDVITIHRGIDLIKFSPRPRSKNAVFTILLPGRYSRIKGHATAIAAMQFVHGAVKLICVGSMGKKLVYFQELQDLIARFNLQDKVTLLPGTNDMPELMAQADLVINTSIVPEAFGRTIAEAQAMNIPVIASNIGAPQEILIDGVTGFLVEPGNPEALAQAISKVQAGMDMAQARINIEKKYSLDSMCANTIKLYKQVINE